MHDLPPHPRSPQRLAEKFLGEASAPTPEPSSIALARAQAGMRVPLVDLVRAAQGATERAAMRVSPMTWFVPALGIGAGAMALNAAPIVSLGATLVAALTLYLVARAVMLRRSPRTADDAPQTMELANSFDAMVNAIADLPSSARDTLDDIDGVLAELLQGALLPSDARDLHAVVTRHLPEALATFRALPPSARAAGEPLLASQLASIRDRSTQLLQSVQGDRLAASRQLDRFLRERSSR
jgi:hypothetical protein